MSFNFGCGREVPGVDEALRQAYHQGVITVASVGNLGSEACVAPPATGPHAIGVGGSTEGGCLGVYSLSGRDVDVIAPGGGPPLTGCPSISSDSIVQVTLRKPAARAASASRPTTPAPRWPPPTSPASPRWCWPAARSSAKATPGRVAAVTKRLRRTARSLGQPPTREGAGLIDAGLATEPRGQAHATRGG